MTILAFLFPFGASKRTPTFQRDNKCSMCANRDPHTEAEHEDALYEALGDKCA